jgi:uncharacterized protein YkwD
MRGEMKEMKGRRRTEGGSRLRGWAGAVLLIVLLCIAVGVLAGAGYLDLPAGGPATTDSSSSSSSSSSVTPAIAGAPGAPPVSTAAIEQYIVLATNGERDDHALGHLRWDADLAAVARSHSEDMAAYGYFDHVNPKGEDPTDRAVRLDYPVIKSLGGGRISTGIGENIGMMPTGNVADYGYVGEDAKAVAEAMVAMWMASPGHRENILEPGYDRIGVGVAYDGTSYIATQDFW